jgi:methionyl-tRNA formyltransferase
VGDDTVRCVFVTGHEFGQSALEGLLAAGEARPGRLRVPLVLTLPSVHAPATVGFDDRLRSSGLVDEQRPAVDARLAGEIEAITDLQPSFIAVIGWSWLIPPPVLDLPARVAGAAERHAEGHGVVGMHPTLLPEGRGRAPIPWTIIKGLHRSGLSVFRLEESADTGGIVLQLPLDVGPRDTSSLLFRRFSDLHAVAGYRLGQLMIDRAVAATAQDEARASVWPARRPADSEIAWTAPVAEVDGLVRALTPPYPSAFTAAASGRLLVRAVAPLADAVPAGVPGTVVATTDAGAPVVLCGDGAVALTEVEWESGTPVTWRPGSPLADH